MVARREFLSLVLGGLGALTAGTLASRVHAARTYAETVDVLTEAATSELSASRRYTIFAQRAEAEDYPGIAYLFTALGTSERTHAESYNAILTKLGAPPVERAPGPAEVGATKQNLIAAAEAEIRSIEQRYPRVLERLANEGLPEALENARYAWESHKQHRDIITQIRDYAPGHFETVARRIEGGIGTFYVCEVCGSTVHELPADTCPICKKAVSRYREIRRSPL